MNLELADDVRSRYAVIRAQPEIISGNINIRQDAGTAIDLFLDLSLTRTRTESYDTDGGTFSLRANDPSNPFQQNILVRYPLPGISGVNVGISKNYGFTAGAIIKLPRNWQSTIEFGRNIAIFDVETFDSVLPSSTAYAAAVRTGTVELLADLNAYLPGYSAFVVTEPDIFTTTKNFQDVASLRVGGPLFELPGGKANLTLLAEYRRDKIPSFDAIGISDTRYCGTSQSVSSAYGEIRLPLVGETSGKPLVHRLELQLSARHDRYETNSATPLFYSWAAPDPIPSSLRSSYGQPTTRRRFGGTCLPISPYGVATQRDSFPLAQPHLDSDSRSGFPWLPRSQERQ